MPTKQKTPALFDERLVTALSHVTRAHALSVFTERSASAKEIAHELGIEISAVSHHVRKLLDLGCIEEVETKKRRGATEHFYRATVRHYFDPAAWKMVPKENRLMITMGVLRLISKDLAEALQGGTVDGIDRHLSRTLLTVDREGHEALHERLDEALEDVLAIREESIERIAASGETPVQASVSMMHFELPSRAASDS